MTKTRLVVACLTSNFTSMPTQHDATRCTLPSRPGYWCHHINSNIHNSIPTASPPMPTVVVGQSTPIKIGPCLASTVSDHSVFYMQLGHANEFKSPLGRYIVCRRGVFNCLIHEVVGKNEHDAMFSANELAHVNPTTDDFPFTSGPLQKTKVPRYLQNTLTLGRQYLSRL